jgi:hypothetical protein
VLALAVAFRPPAVVSVTVTVHEGTAPAGVVHIVVTVARSVGPMALGANVPPQLEAKVYVHNPDDEPGSPVAVSVIGSLRGTGTIRPVRKTVAPVVIQPVNRPSATNPTNPKLLRSILKNLLFGSFRP